jgi:tetratricopeptide (TPR) repeat protein
MTTQARDYRGSKITGSTPRALDAYERALAALVSWRSGVEEHIDAALSEAPEFVMAHVLKADFFLSSREPSAPARSAEVLAHALQLPANAHERLHLAAVASASVDDFDRSRSLLGAALADDPRDMLALHVAHAFDYLSGDSAGMSQRTSAVMNAWSPDMPGYSSVLTMHAFALEERGEYANARTAALRVLELDPRSARAHHVLAHVFEMTGQGKAGREWMRAHESSWAPGSVAATHCWWHTALFHIQQQDVPGALTIYDQHIRWGRSTAVADMIDASALLWRLALCGVDVGSRWTELANSWSARISDGYCTFNDLHAMMAFVGGQHWRFAKELLSELTARQRLDTRHGEMTRLVGLPASRALLAFGQGDFAAAARLLGSLPAIAHRLGGSQAQRDIIQLTLLEAVRRAAQQARRAASARNGVLQGTPESATCAMPVT